MAILRVKDKNGKVQEILVIRGENYNFTEQDKVDIAGMISDYNSHDNTLIPLKCFMPLAEDTASKTITLDSDEGLHVGHWLVKAKYDSEGNFAGWQSREIKDITTYRDATVEGDTFCEGMEEVTITLPIAGPWEIGCLGLNMEIDAKSGMTTIIRLDAVYVESTDEYIPQMSVEEESPSADGKTKVTVYLGEEPGWFHGAASVRATYIGSGAVVTLGGNFSYHPTYSASMEPTIKNGVVFYECLFDPVTKDPIGTTDLILDDTVKYKHLEGIGNTGVLTSTVGGLFNTVAAFNATASGANNKAFGIESTVEGEGNTASGKRSHAEGSESEATGINSHAEGGGTHSSGESSHAEGCSTESIGKYSHAEGLKTKAHAASSHTEGQLTEAYGEHSHAEGYDTEARGMNSHAEGNGSVAFGQDSHAEGCKTEANGTYSHAEGHRTIANGASSHVQGKYNIADTEEKYAHIVGNGSSDTKRSNAHTLDWKGNAWYAGSVECKSIILKSSTPGSTKRFKITIDNNGNLTATDSF